MHLTVTNLSEAASSWASYQLLLYSNEEVIYSICSVAVSFIVLELGSLKEVR